MDSWEKQGIPVSRLSSLDCALGIVEELSRLEEVSDKEVPLVSLMQIFFASSEVEMLQNVHVDENALNDCFSHHGATATIPEVKDAYKLLGLPKETGIDRAAMISRLKHYMIWQDLRQGIVFVVSSWVVLMES